MVIDKLLRRVIGIGCLALVSDLVDTRDDNNVGPCVSVGLEPVVRPISYVVKDWVVLALWDRSAGLLFIAAMSVYASCCVSCWVRNSWSDDLDG